MPVFGQFDQLVQVEGYGAYVHDLSIKESSSQRVASADFAIEQMTTSGQDAAYNACVIGADVNVQQLVNGNTQSWTLRVVDVREKRLVSGCFKRVKCRTLESVASVTRFLGSWENITATALVLDAWQTHAPGSLQLQGISLSGVDTNNTVIEEYASKFDSLYDLMEEVCKLTGWAWKIRDGVLYFFDPLTNTGPDIDQAALGIERDTITLKRSIEGIYNVYRMQAWSYKTISVVQRFEDGGCVDGVLFDPEKLKGYEVLDATIREQAWRDHGLEVRQIERDEGIIRFNGSVVADIPTSPPPSNPLYDGDPMQATVDIRARTLVWVERINEESILLYGRRDAPPISDDGGMDVAAATQYLDELLRYRSVPAVDLTMDLLGVGWVPDQVVDVYLDDPQLTAALYVTDVSRTTESNDLNVSITLTSPGEVVDGAVVQASPRRSRSNVDPAYEIGRRVERLERRLAHPASQLGKNTNLFGVFSGANKTQGAQGWGENVTLNVTNPQTDNWGWQETVTTNVLTGLYVDDSITLG